MAEKQFVKEIADINENFTQWYTDVVLKTQLVDYGPVKGTMVIRPYGYAIWENIQKDMDRRFKENGSKNAYFPLLIPMSFFTKEAEHVEGFAPEVAVVTHAGGAKLEEPLAIRPTSETVIGTMYAKWIQSYRDLPVIMNQWCNVMRWEKTTRPFLRTSEFLWQEGHTVHATEEEAMEETIKMLNVYREFMEETLALPVICGRKTEKEKFAGAVATFGLEAMMLDGKSLQSGTSHYLGQNFSKAFDIKFLDKDSTQKYGYTTSWGTSTRMIGAVIMAHGDQRGLVLPPKIAPIQVIIVPVAAHKGGVIEKAKEIESMLVKAGIRAETDTRDMSPGWKFNEWEMKGVPLRIEIGPRDIENNQAVLVRRDKNEKQFESIDALETLIPELLDIIQKEMLVKSRANRDARIIETDTLDGIINGVDGKFVKAGWCGCRECEDKVKELASATARVMVDEEGIPEKCAICGKPAKHKVIFARAY
ncbi:MAG: proline--tRNA ligase [Clostridiales bacterium]|nr:proline--tRNA ligase [Clostridiales bacterium]